MKNLKILIPSLGLALFLSACGSHELDSALQHGAKKVSSAQLSVLVDGSTMTLEGYGQKASVEFNRHGTLAGKNTSGETDKGEWKIKGEELCLRFKKWGQGDSACYQVVENGGSYQLFNHKGMQIYTMSVAVAGDTPEAPASAGQRHEVATGSPTPAGGSSSAPSREALSVSPQATADVNFIIRQSAQNCPGCNLAHAQLSGQNLVGANLQGANLTEADLSRANLRRANLRGANLYRADLRQADLSGADLTGANLSEAIVK